MLTKNDIREQAKKIRKLVYTSKISDKICACFINTEIYDAADHIMLFHPKEYEINLLPVLNDKTKNFYLPRVEGDKMVVCPYRKGDKLKVSQFGVKEPLSDPVSPEILDIILIPALAVGRNFRRIGYGKGYYDRFLNENKEIMHAVRVVPISSLLVLGNIPYEEHDAVFNIILDEL